MTLPSVVLMRRRIHPLFVVPTEVTFMDMEDKYKNMVPMP
jgi:hypothetical protein